MKLMVAVAAVIVVCVVGLTLLTYSPAPAWKAQAKRDCGAQMQAAARSTFMLPEGQQRTYDNCITDVEVAHMTPKQRTSFCAGVAQDYVDIRGGSGQGEFEACMTGTTTTLP